MLELPVAVAKNFRPSVKRRISLARITRASVAQHCGSRNEAAKRSAILEGEKLAGKDGVPVVEQLPCDGISSPRMGRTTNQLGPPRFLAHSDGAQNMGREQMEYPCASNNAGRYKGLSKEREEYALNQSIGSFASPNSGRVARGNPAQKHNRHN